MTSRSDFKIIVDLTHVYHDARKLTRVFIDSTKIWLIKQLQEHLIELFHIPKPFHLLSTGKTYLPPNEDVRILEQNDVVEVVLGSGLSDQQEMSNCNTASVASNSNSQSMYVNVTNGDSYLKSKQNSDSENNFQADKTKDVATNRTMYHTLLDDTGESEPCSKVDGNSTKDSTDKNEENSLTIKKKRSRSRKKAYSYSSDPDMNVVKKPKVVSNLSLSSAKHIRFDSSDLNVNTIDNNMSVDINDKKGELQEGCLDRFKKTPMKNALNNLMALRQTSTPLTFTYNEKKKPKSMELRDEIKEVNNIMEIDESSTKVKVGDIVDFKVLKMGDNYTPMISNTITAEVMSISPDSATYNLRITSGMNEIQGPEGKFSLPDDSTITESEVISYERKDLLELQIVKSV